MTGIETVRGTIAAPALGRTLMHEHIFIRNQELEENYPSGEWDDDQMHAAALTRMRELGEAGITSLVDLTVMGLGRSIGPIQRLASESPVNIIVATGYYTARDLPGFFQTHGPGRLIDEADPLVGMFIDDITVGISGSGVKAGIIKVVSDKWGITTDVARVFDAAAEAHLQTGVPIATHSNPALRGGLEQQDYFRERGVDLQYVVIGHCGDSTDTDYLRQLMDAGSTIGLDRFGMEGTASAEDRIATLFTLCEMGYAEQIVISQDASLYSVNMVPSVKSRRMPRWVHTEITDHVLPELRRRGVSEETVDQIMVRNPARILTGKASATNR